MIRQDDSGLTRRHLLQALTVPVLAPLHGRAREQAPGTAGNEWRSLFDGQSLGRWEPTLFGGEGEVRVEDGRIVLGQGNDLTGITWKGEVPATVDYEIELKAMRVAGGD